MSEYAPITELPLFAPPAPERVKIADVHAAAEREHAAFFQRVRHLVGGMYGGTGIRVTMDNVHDVMSRYGIDLPPGASPNIFGTMFAGWDRARPVLDDEGKQRMQASRRPGSHGNPLRCWLIV